jgi:TetR/AcrR family fatty acid metabolism transcriptional regulator
MDRKVSQASDARAKLLLVTELHIQFMASDPDLARFLQFQLRQPDESIRKAIAAPLADYARRIESIIEEGKAAGFFRPDVGTRVLRRVYFGAVDETISSWLLRPEGTPLEERVAPLMDVLMNGMRKR